MYKCENCGKEFMAPVYAETSHGLEGPWRQRYPICPYCGVAGMIEHIEEENEEDEE